MSDNGDQKPPREPTPEANADSEPSADELKAKAEAEAKAKAAAEAKAKAAAEAKAKKAAEEAAKPPWERDPAAPAVVDASEDELVTALPEGVEQATKRADELVLEISRLQIAEVCRALSDRGYHLLVDICGADYPEREAGRFEVIYHVYSIDENQRLRLKVKVPEGEEVPSVCSVWRGADWCEREIYDMYGVRFSEHPDMTRILLWEGFNGYPLRKDFPVEGIDTGSAIYPEYYEEEAGPVIGTGTGWKPPDPPEPSEAAEPAEPAAPAELAAPEEAAKPVEGKP